MVLSKAQIDDGAGQFCKKEWSGAREARLMSSEPSGARVGLAAYSERH